LVVQEWVPTTPRLSVPPPAAARLDDALLEQFMQTFFGYGTFQARYWFVGIEECGGESFESIAGQLMEWSDAGKPKLMPLKPKKGDIDPTWGPLIQIVLAAQGQVATPSKIRKYQVKSLGKQDGDTCLLNLLPLPVPSPSDWLYAEFSDLQDLKSRFRYSERTSPRRAHNLRSLIAKHRPAVVVFYGQEQRDSWRQIAGVEFEAQEEHGFECARGESTFFVCMPNPTYCGRISEDFAAIGRHVSLERTSSRRT
jgi:hypothetical protein